MIIGIALKEVFKDKTLLVNEVEVPIQFHFGDQKEFNMWVASKMKSNKQKYPLIWYVINNPEPFVNAKLRVETQLILFQGTKHELFNDSRYDYTYKSILEPLYELVNKTLSEHQYITLLHKGQPIPYKDEPNFGVDTNEQNDFTKVASKQTKSITIDVVDAKILRLKMDIYPKCII
jgi:hypothetical protein